MAGKKDLIAFASVSAATHEHHTRHDPFLRMGGRRRALLRRFLGVLRHAVRVRAQALDDRLRREYTALVQRYDTLTTVMAQPLGTRRNVFRTSSSRTLRFDSGVRAQAGRHLRKHLQPFVAPSLKRELRERVAEMETTARRAERHYLDLQARIDRRAAGATTSVDPARDQQAADAAHGFVRHAHPPFYKTLQSHQGVDLHHSRRVARSSPRPTERCARWPAHSTSGQTVVIDHGNGYETRTTTLSKIDVRKGQQVRRGDIIALSGDTGLSLAPHLHYEVRYNGMRVDPIHYFFMELSPTEYQG